MAEACCTCATFLSNVTPVYDDKTEKPVALDRRLSCCQRVICGTCIYNNARFASYCPFCQISSGPSSLPPGLREPPTYPLPLEPPSYSQSEPQNPIPSNSNCDDVLPTYASLTSTSALTPPFEKDSPIAQPAEDVLHFLNHSEDTLAGLSLRYGVAIGALRRANKLTSDHLLLARRTLLIPGEFYKRGVSLSPRPVEGEEEEIRKGKVRRFMVGCKVAEYDIALLYLKQSEYDLDAAIEAFRDDERWEREHPLEASAKGKGKVKHDAGRRRFTGQRP